MSNISLFEITKEQFKELENNKTIYLPDGYSGIEIRVKKENKKLNT